MATTTARPITGPAAWLANDLTGSTDWIRPFTPGALAELDRALAAVRARGLAWREITRDDFPLPGFGTELATVRHELEHGRGIVLLRGLPVARYTEDELRQLYWGLGTHLGAPRYAGDIQLLNNHVTYHARTAFQDDEAAGRDRLLFRLWLSMPDSRALPPGFEVLWGSIEPGALRGGIAQS
jgi:hypothetical protein